MACIEVPNYRCEGVLFVERKGSCYRKTAIKVASCDKLDGFVLYLRTESSPPLPSPLPPSLPSPPTSPPDLARWLTSGTCRAQMRDRDHKFWTMWSQRGWKTRRGASDPACWGNGNRFWDNAAAGEPCSQDWGSEFDAPSVFGFAETMSGFCNQRQGRGWVAGGPGGACNGAELNILRIRNWNMCRNLQWMMCAVQGRLAPQYKSSRSAPPNGGEIVFSLAPKDLELKPFNENAYPRCCGDYAENDIYYLEVCVLSEICANSDEMWRAVMGDTFRCQVSIEKYRSMQDALQMYG